MDFLRGKPAAAVNFCIDGLKRKWAERSRVGRAAAVALGALALASAAGVASARIPAFAVFGSLMGHFAALAMAALVVALALRSKAGAAVAALVLAVDLGTVGLRVAAANTCPVQMAASGQRVVRIMTLNIRDENRDFAAIERALAQNRPDILLLQELRPHHAALLAQLRAHYPNQIICDVNPDCGIGILSTYRLEPVRAIGEGPVMALEATARVEDHDLMLFATHLQRPFTGQGQADQLKALTEDVAALPANSVVAGDFNSALWSASLSRYVRGAGICASNLTHATWPEWLGPFGVPIDHIFLKRGVRLLSITTVSGTGSDHKGLLATISIL